MYRNVVRSAAAFTLVELLVVIGIIAVLISILLPAMNKARDTANTVACLSNHRQIAIATLQYAAQNKGAFPYGSECTHPSDNGLGQAHASRVQYTWHEYMNDVLPINIRKCRGGSSMSWSRSTKKLDSSGINRGGGVDDKWITVSCRISPRNDHWESATGNLVPQKIVRHRPAGSIMLSVDYFVQSYNHPVRGPIPNPDNDYAGGWDPAEKLRFRHSRGQSINLSFLDGHAETWRWDTCREGTATPNDSYERNLFTSGRAMLPWGTEQTNLQ